MSMTVWQKTCITAIVALAGLAALSSMVQSAAAQENAGAGVYTVKPGSNAFGQAYQLGPQNRAAEPAQRRAHAVADVNRRVGEGLLQRANPYVTLRRSPQHLRPLRTVYPRLLPFLQVVSRLSGHRSDHYSLPEVFDRFGRVVHSHGPFPSYASFPERLPANPPLPRSRHFAEGVPTWLLNTQSQSAEGRSENPQ
jgi:hypothetical protein